MWMDILTNWDEWTIFLASRFREVYVLEWKIILSREEKGGFWTRKNSFIYSSFDYLAKDHLERVHPITQLPGIVGRKYWNISVRTTPFFLLSYFLAGRRSMASRYRGDNSSLST